VALNVIVHFVMREQHGKIDEIQVTVLGSKFLNTSLALRCREMRDILNEERSWALMAQLEIRNRATKRAIYDSLLQSKYQA